MEAGAEVLRGVAVPMGTVCTRRGGPRACVETYAAGLRDLPAGDDRR